MTAPSADRAAAWRQKQLDEFVHVPILGLPNRPRARLPIHEIHVEVRVQQERVRDELGASMEDEARPLVAALALAVARAGEGIRGLVLLGHPGAGKTTLLRRLFCEVSWRPSEALGLPGGLVPVYARLSRLREEMLVVGGLAALVEREARETDAEAAGIATMDGGPKLYLLDGLDEVAGLRGRVGAWLASEVVRHPGSAFVVTSRPAGYTAERAIEGALAPAWVQPLTTAAVEDYVCRWFPIAMRGNLDWKRLEDPAERARSDALALARARTLVEEIRRREQETTWRNLSRNPLLLSAMCLVALDERGLPGGRGELYERALDALLRVASRAEGGSVGLPVRAAIRVLAPLAWEMHAEGAGEELTEWDEVRAAAVCGPQLAREKDLAGLTPIQFIRRTCAECGVLSEPQDGRVRFAHLTFQEYLAARFVGEDPQHRAGTLAELIGQPRWREPTLLAMALPGVYPAYVDAVLARGVAAHQEQLRRCVDEAQGAPDRFVAWLHGASGWWPRLVGRPPYGDVAAVLGLLTREEDPAVREVVGRFVGHPDPVVRRVARGIVAPWRRFGPAAIEAVRVLAGEFLYGEAKERRRTEKEFWIGRHPVTNAQYGAFLNAMGHREPYYWSDERFNRPAQPVVGVDWDDAVAFGDWAGGRLPTEEEWEYAARGADGRKYPWGDTPEPGQERAVFGLEGGTGRPADFGGRLAGASPWGAEDMVGNVWEGTMTPWRDDDAARVLRGGSWLTKSGSLRCSVRYRYHSGDADPFVGFRLCFASPQA